MKSVFKYPNAVQSIIFKLMDGELCTENSSVSKLCDLHSITLWIFWNSFCLPESYWIAAKCIPINLFGASQFNPSHWNCSFKIPPLGGNILYVKECNSKMLKVHPLTLLSLKSRYKMSLMISLFQHWLVRLSSFLFHWLKLWSVWSLLRNLIALFSG